MNTTVKKQNRILLAVLIFILAAAVVLIAVTGGANRKEKNDPVPAETGAAEAQRTAPPAVVGGNTAPAEGTVPAEEKPVMPDAPESAEKDTESAGNAPEDQEVSALQNADEVLPDFSVPVDNFVIKEFSMEVPVFSSTMNDYRVHNGVDIACSVGTPVLAAADGEVCEVTNDPLMGVTVGIRHSGGALTRYRGLSEDSVKLVKNGDAVKRGQVIGASGETALIESAEEDHLHFELLIHGEPADPCEYMKLTRLSDVYEG